MSVIYEPQGRAREYAALACNLYRGCGHGCTYCYAPSATFTKRQEFYNAKPRKDILSRLEADAAAMSMLGQTGQVLLCFTCDPYQPLDDELQITRQAIEILHAYGFGVCTLTKGGYRALRDLDLFTAKDAFATTLTFIDTKDSRIWEPRAADPGERMSTLAQFNEQGIPTWVSLEPVIDPAQSLQIIARTHEYVDLYKIGTLNHHRKAKEIDWHTFGHAAMDLLRVWGYVRIHDPDEAAGIKYPSYYIKDDLARFL
jgi:DNA repair photolyase